MIRKRGGNVVVVFNENRSLSSFNLKKLSYAHFQTVYRNEGGLDVVRQHSWNLVPTSYDLGRDIWVKRSVDLVARYIRKNGRPNVVHVHCAMYAGLVALEIKRRFNIPYIITEHSTLIETSLKDGEINTYKKIYDESEKVIVVSRPFKLLLSSKIGVNLDAISVIPNFIDFQFFNFAGKLRSSNGLFNIVTVCYHEDKKRLDRLISAFSTIHSTFPSMRLIIGGQGPNTAKLIELATSLGLSDKIKFTGFLDKSGVKELLSSSSLFVLPSDVETFGVVLLEAIGMGVPVIGTRSGGPEDIVVDDVGLLIDCDQVALEEAMANIYTNYSKYEPSKIRSHGLDKFGPDRLVQKYLDIYNTFSE